MLAVLLTSTSLAGVVLEEGGGCMTEQQLELELRATLGDDPVDATVITVRLSVEDRPWQLRIDARTPEGESLWWHQGATQPADCPVLPQLISRIAEQQFSGVAHWGLTPPPPIRPEWVVELAGTAPSRMHFALGGGLGFPVTRRLRAYGLAEGYLGAPIALDVDRARTGGRYSARFTGLLLGGGMSYDLVTGPIALRVRPWVNVGPHVAYGEGFAQTTPRVVPRATANLQADLLSSILRIGARVTVPFVRLAPSAEGGVGAEPEPWVRVGFVLGIGAPFGRAVE